MNSNSLPGTRIEKVRSRGKTEKGIRLGRMQRQPCEVCGDPDSQSHHEDYSKPFEITWLCRKHHIELHKERIEQRNGEIVQKILNGYTYEQLSQEYHFDKYYLAKIAHDAGIQLLPKQPTLKHGTHHSYYFNKCRCELCTNFHNKHLKKSKFVITGQRYRVIHEATLPHPPDAEPVPLILVSTEK